MGERTWRNDRTARLAVVDRMTPRLLRSAAVLVACAVFVNSLWNGFALDDVAIIQDNGRVHDLSAMREILLTPYWPHLGAELGLWRPLIILLYAVQWSVGSGSPVVFHVVSIMLHALVTLLVFLLIERLTAAVPAFWGALIFAVHPVHTEVVANVVGQAEMVAAAATLTACLLFATRPAGTAVPVWRALLVAACFAAAVLSKEHAVVLPALLVLLDVAQRRVWLSPPGLFQYARALALPVLLLGGVLTLYLVVRFQVLEGALFGVQAGPQLHYLHGEARLYNALRAFPELLRLLLFPVRLAADYSPAMILPVTGITPMVAAGAALLLALMMLAALTPRVPAAGLPAAWFLLSIITVSNLFFAVGVLLAERTLYLPSVAVSAAVAYGMFHTWHAWQTHARRAVPLLMLVVVALGAARTWTRNPDWQSTRSIQLALMRDFPESYKAQWTHAAWNWQLGRMDLARSHFELALRIYPDDSGLLLDYGSFLIQQQEPDSALTVLQEARRLHPRMPGPVVLMGAMLMNSRQYDAALLLGRQAMADGVDPSVTLPLVAAALDGAGEADEALRAWRRILNEAVLTPRQWAQIAVALAVRGSYPEADRAIANARAATDGDSLTVRLLQEAERRLNARGPPDQAGAAGPY
jgi:protein O-mannosyl-transferase